MLARTLFGSPALRRWKPHGQCAVCRSWDAQALCRNCVERFVLTGLRCERCGLRLAATAGNAATATTCGACMRDPPPFQRCVCALDYVFPWVGLITDFKFNGRVELARPLASQLLQAVRPVSADHSELLLPVPLSRGRLAERGYNQAWEIARHVARSLGTPASASVLERPVETAHQADLPLAQRLLNLRGAFFVDPRRRAAIAHRHVVLLDDVMTSGATLREAAATLLRAGASRVDAWVLARTPPPRH